MDAPTHPIATLPAAPIATAAPVQADSDETLMRLWLHGRGPHTRRAYKADAGTFLAAVGKPLRQITLGDVQDFADTLAGTAAASRARRLSVAKSLITFGHRLGYLPFNVAAPVRAPKLKETLAERIIPEGDVHRLLALETHPRNHAFMRLLYLAGLRISEACALHWRDLQPRQAGGQVTAFGKGGKTRVVLLGADAWRELLALRGDAGVDDAVFRSRSGGAAITPKAGHEIVKAAAARAGLPDALSAHWLRHAHASHALDRGAPIHLVQTTLGHASIATTGRYAHARPNASSSQFLAA